MVVLRLKLVQPWLASLGDPGAWCPSLEAQSQGAPTSGADKFTGHSYLVKAKLFRALVRYAVVHSVLFFNDDINVKYVSHFCML